VTRRGLLAFGAALPLLTSTHHPRLATSHAGHARHLALVCAGTTFGVLAPPLACSHVVGGVPQKVRKRCTLAVSSQDPSPVVQRNPKCLTQFRLCKTTERNEAEDRVGMDIHAITQQLQQEEPQKTIRLDTHSTAGGQHTNAATHRSQTYP